MSDQGSLAYKMAKRKLVLDILEKYPEAPSRELARMLYRDHLGFFPSVENARINIRMYRGRAGKEHREKMRMRKYYLDAV